MYVVYNLLMKDDLFLSLVKVVKNINLLACDRDFVFLFGNWAHIIILHFTSECDIRRYARTYLAGDTEGATIQNLINK